MRLFASSFATLILYKFVYMMSRPFEISSTLAVQGVDFNMVDKYSLYGYYLTS